MILKQAIQKMRRALQILPAVSMPLVGVLGPPVRVEGKPQPAQESGWRTISQQQTRPSSESIFREIVDGHTGTHWLLLRNRARPGAPGRLVEGRRMDGDGASNAAADRSGKWNDPAIALPIIHAGDKVIAEERTAAVAASFEATALGPAAAGAELQVRLKIGGKLVRAVAVRPGRVVLREIQP